MHKLRLLLILNLIYFQYACRTGDDSIDRVVFLRNKGLHAIPDSVFEKGSLEILDVGNNGFIAPVGGSSFENGNIIRRLPDKVCNLLKLKQLDLSYNLLVRLPPCIVNLQQLTELNLSGNADLETYFVVQYAKQMKSLRVLNLFGVRSAYQDQQWIRKSLENLPIKVIITRQEILEQYPPSTETNPRKR